MKRPALLIVSAVLLGLLALLQLLATVSMVAAGILILHKPLPMPATRVPSPLPSSFLPFMMFGFSLFYAALAVWSIVTLIGLVRLRSWARYSILIIAGCITAFGTIATLVSFAMPLLMPTASAGTQPTPDPHLMRGIMFFMGAVYAAFTAIAIAILVYFCLAKTRALFEQNATIDLRPPNTSTGRPRPVAITIVSWIFLLSGPFVLLYSFLPFPAFLFGFTIKGIAGHLVYVVFALVSLSIGYGLLRLRSEARIATIAWIVFGIANMLTIVTPWGSHNFQAYMTSFYPQSPATPTSMLVTTRSILFISFAFGAAINLFLLWLLHRYREAFTPAPPPPPMPIFDAPLPG